jgi:hypothetical protein
MTDPASKYFIRLFYFLLQKGEEGGGVAVAERGDPTKLKDSFLFSERPVKKAASVNRKS